MPSPVPDKPTLEGLEAKWSAAWEKDGLYRFDRSQERSRVFAIDTPPPTVSGSLHVGHVFSYTHTDTVARYKRMRGYAVFYPMGWDDNGLATERRVQNYFGVTCDPSLPYQPDLEPPAEGGLAKGQRPLAISRPNFVELCGRLVVEDEKAFEAVWRRLGLSVDWSHTYTTIGTRARRAAQRGFLRMLARGEAYCAEAPTLWDVDFRTAVAQAEIEDREQPGAYYQLAFHLPDGSELPVDTTRPELLPACVAVVAHPDDPRWAPLAGTTVRTPLFGVEVPVLTHPLAQPDKGTGVAMVCTFGDLTDVTWWRELSLPVRNVMGRDGRLLGEPPAGLGPEAAILYREHLAGRSATQARRAVAELLGASGELRGQPRPITHPVKFYEKGDRPLEIVTSRQWFFKTVSIAPQLLARGQQLRWHPPHMVVRYNHWVEGLTGDWLISRQRFFGVPFPVWYRLDQQGQPNYDQVLLPDEGLLPVDPSTDAPPGFSEDQRGRPGGFVAEPDVMDTWATSSLTPQIAGGWEEDPDLWERVFPMDLRPQAHEIIRTWLFTTVVRSHLEHGCLPWSDAAISGWILDPDRKKMSKSKGNVVTPMDLLERYGSDAVRYWAACARPGTDTTFDEGQMRIGRKLAIKLLNASRFVLTSGDPAGELPFEAIDMALCRDLGRLVEEATAAFEDFDYARALERTEAFFWRFCDDYLELVKNRALGSLGEQRARSARAALRLCLSVLLRLFAPFLPYVTEEIWSWHELGSIHRSSWPRAEDLAFADQATPTLMSLASAVLAEVRKAKTQAGVSLRAPVACLTLRAEAEPLKALQAVADDLKEAGSVEQIVFEDHSGPLEVEVVLA